jgi:hypothetical protein
METTAVRKADRKRIALARQQGDHLAAVIATWNPAMAHYTIKGMVVGEGSRPS